MSLEFFAAFINLTGRPGFLCFFSGLVGRLVVLQFLT